MIYILSWTTKKHWKTLFRLLHSKLKKIQGHFKDLHRNLRTFQGLPLKFKEFSRLQTLLKTLHLKLLAILSRVSKVGNTGESQSPSSRDKIYISFPMDKTGTFYLVRRRQAGNLFFVSLFEEEKSPGMNPIKLVTSDEWERSLYC